MPAGLLSMEPKTRFVSVACFRKRFPEKGPIFTPDELSDLQQGNVYQCVPRYNNNNNQATLAQVILGVVQRICEEDAEVYLAVVATTNNIDITSLVGAMKGIKEWSLTPLCCLISELRQFEACTMPWNEVNLPFLPSLLGNPPATTTTITTGPTSPAVPIHINFPEGPGTAARTETPDEKKNVAKQDSHHVVSPMDHVDQQLFFDIPRMNATQEQATSTFLKSAPGCITIVQGPPGTGKTSLLISIICRYLLESRTATNNRTRLMVCAPTNKAVTVLATRFIQATKDDSAFNAILVGDAGKLLMDEQPSKRSAHENESSFQEKKKLRSMLVYQWMSVVIEEYRGIKALLRGRDLKEGEEEEEGLNHEILDKARTMHQRLAKSLPGLPLEVLDQAKGIHDALQQWTTMTSQAKGVMSSIDKFVKVLKGLKPETVRSDLMSSANLIFCTLTSAGGLLFKSTGPVHDLIIDEAAAATEPALYIPFRLSPKRLLIVGDPLQLPATVVSRRAERLGLSKSLHERLMYHCRHEHIMLGTQYRMKPEISLFPAQHFYQGKILNGDNVTSPLYKSHVKLLDGKPFSFLQVDGNEIQIPGGSYHNHAEAAAVVNLIYQIRESAGRNPTTRDKWHDADRLRVITFYKAQVSLLQKKCRAAFGPHVVVGTVDSSQGCESDIVIVSFVRSNNDGEVSRVNQAGFLTDNRRVNVALTRAKHQLICVGNAKGFANYTDGAGQTLQLLATHADNNQRIFPFEPSYQLVESRPNRKRTWDN